MNGAYELHGRRMRTLHLFAGAGGGILADLLLGHRPVCAVEIDPYCRSVLDARMRDGSLPWFPVFDDVRSFRGDRWRDVVNAVCGGFPCQDISCAGKGTGIDGERSGLWAEMARIVAEVRPRSLFVENSPLLLSRGLTRVLSDLAGIGPYEARWLRLGADDVGAPHRRKRFWMVADRACERVKTRVSGSVARQEGFAEVANHGREGAGDLADADSEGLEDGNLLARVCGGAQRTGPGEAAVMGSQTRRTSLSSALNPRWVEWLMGFPIGWTSLDPLPPEAMEQWRDPSWWETDPADLGVIPRVSIGEKNRVGQLKALGNAQVPLCAATAWNLLSEPSA